jgi:hypothetical protein
MAQQAERHGELAGPARLVMVQGAALLHPEQAVFEAMLAGWRCRQRSRLLAGLTVRWRERIVRRFTAFTGELPWRWAPCDVEEWASELLSGDGHAHATIRSYQGALACFPDYLTDARYGWAAECEARFGTYPCRSAMSGTPRCTPPTMRAGRGGGRSPGPSCRRFSISPASGWRRSASAGARAGWRPSRTPRCSR